MDGCWEGRPGELGKLLCRWTFRWLRTRCDTTPSVALASLTTPHCTTYLTSAPREIQNLHAQLAFDQTEFSQGDGFQDNGWIYIPRRCKSGSGDQVCKLLVRPDACNPERDEFASDVPAFADYAETNALVVLHPCLGGALDKSKYPHAPDVEKGKLDTYGQLTPGYVEQNAPHMRAIGNMVRTLLGMDKMEELAAEKRQINVMSEEVR